MLTVVNYLLTCLLLCPLSCLFSGFCFNALLRSSQPAFLHVVSLLSRVLNCLIPYLLILVLLLPYSSKPSCVLFISLISCFICCVCSFFLLTGLVDFLDAYISGICLFVFFSLFASILHFACLIGLLLSYLLCWASPACSFGSLDTNILTTS